MKTLWEQWMKSKISEKVLIDTIAQIVREARNVNLAYLFRVWYELEKRVLVAKRRGQAAGAERSPSIGASSTNWKFWASM